MTKLAVLPLIGSLLLAACASTPEELPSSSLAAPQPAPAATLVATAEGSATSLPTDVLTIDAEDLNTGVVCEAKRRPGSRIAATVCYSQEERAALQKDQADAARQYARDLDRERAMRESQGRPLETQQHPVIAFQ